MRKFIFGLGVCIGITVISAGCKHEPFGPMEDGDLTPVDTTGNPVDTTGTGNPGDTTATGVPCDPDLVYFQLQILPILQSNCALQDCHNAASAQDGVVLTSYEKVMETADVEPFDLSESKLYKVLVDDEVDDRMPLAPRQPLGNEQINLISRWILQGAKDLTCDPDINGNGCPVTNVSFANHIKPILQTHCITCHSGPIPSGGYDFSVYSGAKKAVDNNRLAGAVQHLQGFVAMPLGGARLPDCEVSQIKAWVDAGGLNN